MQYSRLYHSAHLVSAVETAFRDVSHDKSINHWNVILYFEHYLREIYATSGVNLFLLKSVVKVLQTTDRTFVTYITAGVWKEIFSTVVQITSMLHVCTRVGLRET